MNRRISPVLFVLGLILVIAGCDSATTDEGGVVTLSGQVLSSGTNNPLSGAVIRVEDVRPEIVRTTDAQGAFSFEVAVDSTMNLEMVVFKEGYRPDTAAILAVPGRTISVPAIQLDPISPESKTTGEAATIALKAISSPQIGVRESGSTETTQLEFVVQDSTGRAVDLAHGADVRFAMGSAPGGAEFIYPSSIRTDNNGVATVNVASGTRAGTVQIIAEATVGSRTIRSKPVAVVIHGGLPDLPHFSVGPVRLNFPGWHVLGLTNTVTAYVGDKYGNPVKPGTAVYFTTTGGIVEGSALTSDQGAAGATLISAAPLPVHPELGPGYATITARTADENQNGISVETTVLFSGLPTLTVEPYDSLGLGVRYTFHVSDQNGNPLAGGTTIRVTAEGENVKAVGNTDVTLDDGLHGGAGRTDFSFVLSRTRQVDDEGRPVPYRVDAVKITVSGPNGRVEGTLSAGGAFKVKTPG